MVVAKFSCPGYEGNEQPLHCNTTTSPIKGTFQPKAAAVEAVEAAAGGGAASSAGVGRFGGWASLAAACACILIAAA